MGELHRVHKDTNPAEGLEDRDLLVEAERRGWTVQIDDPQTERHVVLDRPKTGSIKLAIASDTHLGSKYQQLTHWQDFCQQANEWGCDFGLHCGDVVDGIHKMHRGMEYEQFKHGYEAQRRYAVENWPEIQGGWTVIGGNHDGSFHNEAGANILTDIAHQRDDIRFLGAPVATLHISGLRLMLVHPDGGVAYARSYKPQKAIEQVAPENKPHVWLAGHWHTPVYLPAYRNVEGISLPCFQSQTPYLSRKGLFPVIGGLLLELEYSEHGLEDITTHWVLYRRPVEKDY